MIKATRIFKPFFTVGNFIKHWFFAYFFGVMIITAIVFLIYNVWSGRKGEKDSGYHRLNKVCIVVIAVCTIILIGIYG